MCGIHNDEETRRTRGGREEARDKDTVATDEDEDEDEVTDTDIQMRMRMVVIDAEQGSRKRGE